MDHTSLQQKTFLLLLAAVSAAFAWVIWPYFGAVFWGFVLALLFRPLYRLFMRRVTRGSPNLAALGTVLVVVIGVLLPLALIAAALTQQAGLVVQAVQSRQFDAGAYLQQALQALPPWVTDLLDRLGINDIGSIRDRLSAGAVAGSKLLAAQALNIGQNTFEFLVGIGVMLYLLFFVLRDGPEMVRGIARAVPLSLEHQRHLAGKFTTVIRATVKGNVAVALVQGLIGGITLWLLGVKASLLWGVLMTLLSLLPAVGAALVWVPIAAYFILTGVVWKGVVLIAVGVLVIGLVDNILRPILVGKDTQMPDWLVLISTLGGIALFGLNGFVIGPVIAALFIAAWDLFADTKAQGQAGPAA